MAEKQSSVSVCFNYPIPYSQEYLGFHWQLPLINDINTLPQPDTLTATGRPRSLFSVSLQHSRRYTHSMVKDFLRENMYSDGARTRVPRFTVTTLYWLRFPADTVPCGSGKLRCLLNLLSVKCLIRFSPEIQIPVTSSCHISYIKKSMIRILLAKRTWKKAWLWLIDASQSHKCLPCLHDTKRRIAC